MNKYLPTSLAMSVYDIDFVTLYAEGKKVILFDLDNTIASYEDTKPTTKQIALNEMLRKIGYKIYIVSNNHEKRVKEFTNAFYVDGYLVLARKPFTNRINKFIKKNNLIKEEIIMVGDQLLTDIACANKLSVTSILVKSISRKTEKWYTKINRLREKKVIKKLSKIDLNKAKKIQEIIGKGSDSNE